ncbi:Polyribonucleotide nucleotidyltransferase 2 mitochondrial [Bienertia sinuspersici]
MSAKPSLILISLLICICFAFIGAVATFVHESFVTRVSDVVSIGQQLSLMCIGQDVRGNIKLSRKAILPQAKEICFTDEDAKPTKVASQIWASIEDDDCDSQGKHSGTTDVAESQNLSATDCGGRQAEAFSAIDTIQKDKKDEAGSGIRAKDLKTWDNSTSKVYQIRARGLVLDLGGGLKGMYRFEKHDKGDYKVGDELRVQCSSFTGKGVPIMSLVKDE